MFKFRMLANGESHAISFKLWSVFWHQIYSYSSHSIVDGYTPSILSMFKNQTSKFTPESKSPPLAIYWLILEDIQR